jgi:predicted amino acid racemase
VLRAEVLEGYTKPVREGERRRLVLGIGRQDLGSGSVRFLDAGLRELGRSADYVVVEQDGGDRRVDVGDMVHMIPSYEALVAAWTSPYVELRLR